MTLATDLATDPRGGAIGLVSVYMPTHNRLELLQRAVASVLGQSHADFELIVVDDGSGDGSFDWLQAQAAHEPRLRVLRNETPQRAPSARNRAIEAARGEWVTGLDDDDEFAPGRLAAFVAVASTYRSLGIAFSALYTQDETVGGPTRRVTRRPARVAYEDLFRHNFIGNQIFVRRADLIEAGMYDPSMPAWHDLDMTMRVTHRFGPALLVDLPLYRYHHDDRPDRISLAGKQRIVEAYDRLIAKWPQAPARARQQLYLQVLGDHYGFRTDPADWLRYLRLGLSPGALRRLLRHALR